MVFLVSDQLSSVPVSLAQGERSSFTLARFLGGGVGYSLSHPRMWWKAMPASVIPPPARVALHLGDHQGQPPQFLHQGMRNKGWGFCVLSVSEPVLEPVHHARSPCQNLWPLSVKYETVRWRHQCWVGSVLDWTEFVSTNRDSSWRCSCPLLPRSESCRHGRQAFFFYVRMSESLDESWTQLAPCEQKVDLKQSFKFILALSFLLPLPTFFQILKGLFQCIFPFSLLFTLEAGLLGSLVVPNLKKTLLWKSMLNWVGSEAAYKIALISWSHIFYCAVKHIVTSFTFVFWMAICSFTAVQHIIALMIIFQRVWVYWFKCRWSKSYYSSTAVSKSSCLTLRVGWKKSDMLLQIKGKAPHRGWE